MFLLALAAAASVLHAQQPVTFDRILRANQEPQNWLTYSGSLSGHRYTAADADHAGQRQEPRAAVGVPDAHARGADEKFEATPLVVDGVMYTVLAAE